MFGQVLIKHIADAHIDIQLKKSPFLLFVLYELLFPRSAVGHYRFVYYDYD